MIPQVRKGLSTREEAGDFLRVKPQTLAVWHSAKRYRLPVVKVGRLAMYRVSDLEQFIESRTVGATEEG